MGRMGQWSFEDTHLLDVIPASYRAPSHVWPGRPGSAPDSWQEQLVLRPR